MPTKKKTSAPVLTEETPVVAPKAKRAPKATKVSTVVEPTSGTDLKSDIAQLRKDYLLLRLKQSSGELRQPHLLRQARREIARKLTILNRSK